MNKLLEQVIYMNITIVQSTLRCSGDSIFPFVQREALHSLKIRINSKLSIKSNLIQNQTDTFFMFRTYCFVSREDCSPNDLDDMVVSQSKDSPDITFVDCWINSCKAAIFSMRLTKQLWRLKNDNPLSLKCKVTGEKILTLKKYSILKFCISFTKREVKTKMKGKL